MLPTRVHRAEYQQIDRICQRCGREIGTIDDRDRQTQDRPEEVARELGLTENGDEDTWRETRRTFVKWENASQRRSAE